MGFLKKLLNSGQPKKKTANPMPSPVVKPVEEEYDFNDGLQYMRVREKEDSPEKWRLMLKFAEHGDEIALFEVGEAYMLNGSMVKRDGKMAEKYLLKSIEKGMVAQGNIRLGQLYLRSSVDVYPKDDTPLTEEQQIAADKEFDRRFEVGTAYLVEALHGRNLMYVEQAVEIIAGTIRLGYNVGDIREFFMEFINLKLPAAVKKIEEQSLSENADEASDAWYKLGCLYLYGVHYEDDLDEAKSCFEKSLELNEWNADARIALNNPLFED